MHSTLDFLPDRKESDVPKLKCSYGLTVLIYTVMLAELEKMFP